MRSLMRHLLMALDVAAVIGIALAAVCLVALAAREAHAAPIAVDPTFSGKFELVPLFKTCKPPRPHVARCPIQENGHSYYALRDRISLREADGTVLTAPAGMTTDLASIPAAVWWLLPPDGPWAEAAIPHDDCYRTRGTFAWRWPSDPKSPPFVGLTGRAPLTRAECDEALRQGMVALGVSAWQRITIWSAVRVGGSGGWGR